MSARQLFNPTQTIIFRVLAQSLSCSIRQVKLEWNIALHEDISKLLKHAINVEELALNIDSGSVGTKRWDAVLDLPEHICQMSVLADLELDFSNCSSEFEDRYGSACIKHLASTSLTSLRILYLHSLMAEDIRFPGLPNLRSLTISSIMDDPIDVLVGLDKVPETIKHLNIFGLPARDYLLSAIVPEAYRAKLESLTLETAHDYGQLFTIGDMREYTNLRNLDLGTTVLSSINAHELPSSLEQLSCRLELSTSLYDFVDVQSLRYLRRIDFCGTPQSRTPQIERLFERRGIAVTWTNVCT